MKKKIQRILNDIKVGKNIDSYLTIFISLFLGLLGLFNIVDFGIIAASILVTLSLLSLSLLSNRRVMNGVNKSLNKIDSQISHLDSKIHLTTNVSDVLTIGYRNLAENFQDSTRISILGTTLLSTVTIYYAEFYDLLKDGVSFRFIVTDPKHPITSSAADRSLAVETSDSMKRSIETSIDRIKSLIKIDKCKVELKKVPFYPAYGIVIIERKSGKSKIFVKLMSFRNPDGMYPTIIITESDDEEWYLHFSSEYERLWLYNNWLGK